MIILASGSEGRKELFEQMLGNSFRIDISGADEENTNHLNPKELVEELAQRKLKITAERFPNDCICAFDTIVEINGEILGKPKNIDEARIMLRKLSHKEQNVWTGYALKYEKDIVCGAEKSVVLLEMNAEQIEEYITTHTVVKFAGGYAVQKQDESIKIISGTIDTIIGAPMEPVMRFLKKHRLIDSL